MAARYELEMKITSAVGLKNVNWRYGEDKPYASVSVEPGTKYSTYAAGGGTSHGWNQKLVIPFSTPVEKSTLHIDIIHAEAADDTKPLIGSAEIGLNDLFGAAEEIGSEIRAKCSLQVARRSGRPQGSLGIDVSIRELAVDVNDDDFDCEPMEVDVFM